MAYLNLLRVTILAFIVTLSKGEEKLKITPEVTDLLIKEGESGVTLTCTSSSSSGLELKWTFPEKDVIDYAINTGLARSGRESTLKLEAFRASRAGSYSCEQADGSDTYTKEINLILVTETKSEPTYQYGDEKAELSCSIVTSGTGTVEKITWMKGDKPVSALPDSSRFEEKSESLVIDKPAHGDVGNYTAVIKVHNIDTPYKCNVEFKDNIVQINPIKREPTYHKDNTTAVLSCNVTERKVNKVEWLKNNTSISDLENHQRFTVDKETNALTIDKPVRKDAGLYISRMTLEGVQQPYDCEVVFRAGPNVLDFKKSKNLIEKDNMELQCNVEGYPRPVVTWLKNGNALNVSQDKRIELHAFKGYMNARLVIKEIEFSDEGEYTCKAYSSYFNQTNEKNITVRVKDKLAALWPFLGIVCEVLILCTIIFIYEKRRNKRAEQEENKAQEAFIKEQKEGVRHRNQKK